MSATTVYAGLAVRLATVSGIKAILLGEPTALHDSPILYTILSKVDRLAAGSPPSDNLTEMQYTFMHRLAVRWQDNPTAEAEILSFVNAIPYAISEDPHLGGTLTRGMARISEGTAGFATIASTLYRVLDFTTVVLEKAPRSTGL